MNKHRPTRPKPVVEPVLPQNLPQEHAPAAAPARHHFTQISVAAPAPQAKLSVNTPGDVYEQEADHVADEVMQMEVPAPGETSITGRTGGQPQAKPLPNDPPAATNGDTALQGLQSGGMPLAVETRAFMEPRFGHDFSQVRIHTGDSASAAAEALQARAFTIGNDIAFGRGAYQPGNQAGQHLLAHELTHVVQQSGGRQSIQREDTPAAPPPAPAAGTIEWLDGPHKLPAANRSTDQKIQAVLSKEAKQPTVNDPANLPAATLTPEQDAIVKQIKQHRATVNTTKFTLGVAKEGTYGHQYNGAPSKDPTPTQLQQPANDRATQVRQAIWEELASEGGTSAINAYDSQVLTWGRGFGFKGELKPILDSLFADQAIISAFAPYGITYLKGEFLVVNTDNNMIESGASALALIQAKKDLLDAFVHVAEGAGTKQKVADAQFDHMDAHIKKIPKKAYDTWPLDSLRFAFHINHWGGKYGWATHPKDYEATEGKPDALVLTFGKIAAEKPEANGAYIVSWSPEQQIQQFKHWGNGVAWNALKQVCPVPLPLSKDDIKKGPKEDFADKVFIIAPGGAGFHAFPSLPTAANVPSAGGKDKYPQFFGFYNQLNAHNMSGVLSYLMKYAQAGPAWKRTYGGAQAIRDLLNGRGSDSKDPDFVPKYDEFTGDFGPRYQFALRAVLLKLSDPSKIAKKADREKQIADDTAERTRLLDETAAHFGKDNEQHLTIETFLNAKAKRAAIPGEPALQGLDVSQPGDPDEQEAERVAEQVVNTIPSGAAPGQATLSLPNGGQPLDHGTRALMEPRFGHDFSQVRVHADAHAARLARSVNALAFTVGNDIRFGAGQYQPNTRAGQRLLAHELAHTLAPGSQVVQRKPAAPSGKSVDPAKLKITTTLGAIDYHEFVRKGSTITVNYSSSETNFSSDWSLYDATDTLVDTNSELGGGTYDLTAAIVRPHVDSHGVGSLGTWTLRYEKGDYYHEVDFSFTEGSGPGPAITDSVTAGAFFNIRDLPGKSSKVIGALAGTPIPVTVSDKTVLDGQRWYKITLKAALGSLAAGTEGWIIEDGIVATITWDFFISQLRKFEADHSGLTLDQRITKLRQMSHKKDLPFDSIIGTSAGTEYLDTRGFIPNEWEILRDSQTVRVPDGTKVDVYHLLVGMDVLPRKVEHQTYWGFDVGQNYSAATWSGDIGAGAADALLEFDKDWEKRSISATASDADKRALRLDHYYTTRAPESDLIGDVDAWGVHDMRTSDSSLDSIEKLLTAYYAGTTPNTAGPPTPPAHNRKMAIETFLKHYGFKTGSALKSQGSQAAIVDQILSFAKMWIRNRSAASAATYSVSDLKTWYAEPMADKFLDWLDTQASAVGASVP